MANDNGQKKKALDLAVKQIHREHGKGSIMKMGEEPDRAIKAIPTGSLTLDAALGVGGVPRGRIVEIYGPEASGKRRSRSISSPKPKSLAAPVPSLTQSMRSIPTMPKLSASTSMSFSSLSPTPGSRHSTSATPLFEAVRST